MKTLVITSKYKIRESLTPTSYVSVPYTAETYYEAWEYAQKYIRSLLGSDRRELSITIEEKKFAS